MERRFHVVFTGRLHAGFKHADTVEKMVLLFQLDREKVTKLLFSGRPTILKQHLSWEQARKYRDHLEQIGLLIKIIEADPLPPPQVSVSISPSPAVPPDPENSVSESEGTDTTSRSRPAEAPQPSPPPAYPGNPSSEEKGPESDLVPFKVESSHGWLWIKQAFGMFFKQPLTWTALMILLLVISLFPLSFHPYFGGLLSVVLAQVFLGGLMLGTQRRKKEGKFRIAHLFLGFRHNFLQLLLGSLFFLLALMLLATITVLSIGKFASSETTPATPEVIIAILRDFPLHLAGLSIAAAFTIPLIMGYWFTPCLTVIDKQSAFTSFRLSFKAVRMNTVAFIIYVLVLLFLGMLFVFLYGAIAALCSFFLGSDQIFLFMFLPTLSVIVLGIPLSAIIPLSIYTGYRDIFHEQGKYPPVT
jgi:hypothetical protein